MKKIKINNRIKVAVGIIAMVVLLSFSERKMNGRAAFDEIQVKIENNHDNHYLDDADILKAVDQVIEDEKASVNLKKVELALLENPYIQQAQVYKDLKNHLLVNVRLRRPLARMVRKNRSHAYISYDGYLLPISSKYTSRVPVLSGPYAEGFNRDDVFQNDDDKQVFDLLHKINDNEFFRAQIAQLVIDKKMNIKMYPQVTKQLIEFGKPVDIDNKFRKLMIFYQKILPQKGWNEYSRVNVDFKGQIVAE